MTVPVNVASLKMLFPEFASQSDAMVGFAIERAARGIDPAKWGTDANLALSYLAAHYLMVAVQRAASGTGQAIQSERIGEITISYQAQKQPDAADPSDLTTTPYGADYLQLAGFNFPAIAII